MGRVLEALRLLQPRQQNSGAGAIQVDRAGRDVRVSHQTHHAPVTHVHVTQHIYAPGAAPPPAGPAQRAAPVLPDRFDTKAKPVGALPAQQREALALMKALGREKRIAVLDFMRREFGTAMVKELDGAQCLRLQRYVQRVIENQGR